MAKAIRFFCGTSSMGDSVEVAQSVNGEFYCRYDVESKYGKQFCKWCEYEPTFNKTFTNVYSGEVGIYDKPRMAWGFKELLELDDMPRVRLPNA